MTNGEFVELVWRTYTDMPVYVIQSMDNVDIVVEECPELSEHGPDGDSGTLVGLYHGIPLTDREFGDPIMPDRIVIYRQPILQNCSTHAEVEYEIKVTLWHEVGHYFGMTEEDLHRLGYN